MHNLVLIQELNNNMFRNAPANENRPEWSTFYSCMRETDRVIRECQSSHEREGL